MIRTPKLAAWVVAVKTGVGSIFHQRVDVARGASLGSSCGYESRQNSLRTHPGKFDLPPPESGYEPQQNSAQASLSLISLPLVGGKQTFRRIHLGDLYR